MHLLVHNNANSIVEKAFTKDDGVEFGVDLILVKYGENGHRVGSWQGGTEDEALQQGDIQRLEAQ